jgi:hypothetical protein
MEIIFILGAFIVGYVVSFIFHAETAAEVATAESAVKKEISKL